MTTHIAIFFGLASQFIGITHAQTLQEPANEISCPPVKNEKRKKVHGGHGLGMLEISPASTPRRFTGCKRIYSDNDLIITYEFAAGVLLKAELGGPNNERMLCHYDARNKSAADASRECEMLKEISQFR